MAVTRRGDRQTKSQNDGHRSQRTMHTAHHAVGEHCILHPESRRLPWRLRVIGDRHVFYCDNLWISDDPKIASACSLHRAASKYTHSFTHKTRLVERIYLNYYLAAPDA